MTVNRRIDDRYQAWGLMSNISDGTSAFLGIVEDISPSGVRVSQISANFDDSRQKYASVINGPVDDFRMNLQPRWVHVTNRGMYKMIGFKIRNPPPSWTEFVMLTAHETEPLEAWSAV